MGVPPPPGCGSPSSIGLRDLLGDDVDGVLEDVALPPSHHVTSKLWRRSGPPPIDTNMVPCFAFILWAVSE
jgi:hypothetical protein